MPNVKSFVLKKSTFFASKKNACITNSRQALFTVFDVLVRRSSSHNNVVELSLSVPNGAQHLLNYGLKNCWSASKLERETVDAEESLMSRENNIIL